MLFSATMPPEIEKLTKTILRDPVKVAVTPVSSTVDSIEQSVYFVNKGNKTKLLIHLLQEEDIDSALVFSRTKHGANKIEKDLLKAGIKCGVIHSNKGQNARNLALAQFKNKQSRVLVATDIVEGGLTSRNCPMCSTTICPRYRKPMCTGSGEPAGQARGDGDLVWRRDRAEAAERN